MPSAAVAVNMSFDQKIILLEKAFVTANSFDLSSSEKLFFQHYHQDDLSRAFESAQKNYMDEKLVLLRAFWLHMICVVTEKTYDLKTRQVWMREWDDLLLHDPSDYVTIAKLYHQAVSCYFESHLREAFSKFAMVKENVNVTWRFKALATMHLGLIHSLKNSPRLALAEFKAALEISEHIQHHKLQTRLQNEIYLIESDEKLHLLNKEIRHLIIQKDYKFARKSYLATRRTETKKKLSRQVSSLHALLPALMLLKKSFKTSIHILKYVSDPAVKVQALMLMKHLSDNQNGIQYLEQQIKDELGLETVSQQYVSDDLHILGQSLHQIEQPDLARFAKVLYENKSVGKEDICLAVFSLPYDPVIHDGRIYKLIHKFRNYFGKKDILVNRYGTYEINPKYRTSAS